MGKHIVKSAAAFFICMIIFLFSITVLSGRLALAETRPQLTINNKDAEILKVGQGSQITIKVTSDNLPVAGQDVWLEDGLGDLGTTGADGTVTADINPNFGSDIGIHVGDQFYRGKLFAVEDDQGVIEVRLKDKVNADLDNFYVWAKNGDMQREIDGEGSSVRVLAREGLNTIVAEKPGYGDAGSYFVEKNVTVTAGTAVTPVQITQTDYVETNISFKCDDNPIANSAVNFGKYYEDSGLQSRYIGDSNELGVRKVYVSPGAYKVAINGNDSSGDTFYFIDNKQIAGGVGSYTCRWYQANTGIVNLNIINPVPSEMQKNLMLDGFWINFDNSTGVRINSGIYKLDIIGMQYKINDQWQWYNYRMPRGQEETVNINAGASVNLSYDITPLPLRLEFYNDDMQDGDILLDNPVHFGVIAPTTSGYLLEDKEGNRDWDFIVIKPNGEKNYWRGYFKDQWWYLEANNPTGEYTINASGNLESLYGYTNLSASFIAKKPTITIDDNAYKIVRAGEDSEITIKVTLDGQPIPGQKVSLDGYGEWITGEDGTFTTAIHPWGGGNIGIHLNDKFNYYDLLFAVNDSQGVAEIRLGDKEGNVLSNFFVKAGNGNMDNEMDGEGNAVRVFVNEGINTITVVRPGEGDKGGYFIVKDVELSASLTINPVYITADDYIEADLNFKEDGNPINYIDVRLGWNSPSYGWFTRYIGSANSVGMKKAFVSPGIKYSVAVNGYYNDDDIYFIKENQDILPGPNIYEWYQEDTGRVRLNMPSTLPNIINRIIDLDGQWIVNNNEKGIIMNTGTYGIDKLQFDFMYNNLWMWCSYTKPVKENITINTRDNNLFYDLTPEPLQMKVDGKKENIPGDMLRFGLISSTPSGYQLDGLRDHENIHFTLQMPDGRQADWDRSIRDSFGWGIGENEPTGVYTAIISGNLEPLYEGGFTLTDTFTVLAPEITVNDKEFDIIRAGENSAVTIKAVLKGQPLVDKDVSLDGFGYIGTTDENGIVTVSINPDSSYTIGVHIGDYYFSDILFAVDDNHGVVEVELQDNMGSGMENFFVKVQSQNMWQEINCIGNRARVLAASGPNTMAVAYAGRGDEASYYIVKDITVAAGLDVNSQVITSVDYVETDMKFMFDEDPLKYSTIILGKTGFDFTNKNIGNPNDGGMEKVYISSGDYHVEISGNDDSGNTLYLMKNNQYIGSGGNYTFQWYQADTCRVKLNIDSPLPSIQNRVLDLGGQWISFNDPNGVLINSGDYVLNKIHLDFQDGDRGMWCDYQLPGGRKMPDSPKEIIMIRPGSLNLYYNLNPQDLHLWMNGKKYNQLGDSIWYGIEAPTPSGYELVDMSDCHNADFTIYLPGGSVQNGPAWFYTVGWGVAEGEPNGQYIINFKGNLSPLYGDYDLTGEFIVGMPQVEINNKQYEIINVGESTEITVSAYINGQPIQHENIHIGGYASGETDENGDFTAVINPNHGEDINISLDVDGKYIYNSVLFAVDENQGVVEITADDKQSNPMKDFWARVTSQYMDNFNYSGLDGGKVRILANKGDNLLLLNKHTDDVSYNIVKQINVIPGTSINNIFVDSLNTVEANLSFNYNGMPITNADVIIEKLDQSYYGNMHGAIGQTDNNGHIKVCITPGPYLITIAQTGGGGLLNGDNTLMYLEKDNIQIFSSGDYKLNWSSGDVGKLTLNIRSPFNSLQRLAVDLNNSPWIYTENGSEMIISAGSYNIGGIHLEDNTGGEWMGYDFRKHQSSEDTVFIDPGDSFNYNVDLTTKSVEMKLDSKLVQKGSLLKFGIESLSNSGYLLSSLSNHNLMNVEIVRPDRSTVNLWQNFMYGGYFIGNNDPEGIYAINAAINFGPVLGEYYFTDKFQVVSDTSVYVDSTSPPNGAREVPVNTQIKVNFHCNIQKGDAFNNIMLIAENGLENNMSNVDVSIYKNTLTISPKVNLNYNTKYMVKIPAYALKSEIGNPLKQDYTFTFTTQKPTGIISGPGLPVAPITNKLAVVDSSPDDNSTGVPINQVITISFNTRINITVQIDGRGKSQSISLRSAGGELVPVIFSAIDNKLVIKPIYNLNFNTEYKLVIPCNAVYDDNNNGMENSYSLNFETEPMVPEAVSPRGSGDDPQVIPASIVSVDEVTVTVFQDSEYKLPDTVTAYLSDGSKQKVGVIWEPLIIDTGKIWRYTLLGSIEGYGKKASLTLNVIAKQVRKTNDIK